MASIKKKSGGGGGANWMDTYGDMVTLLLCFFVLLYSISSLDEAKWMIVVQSFNKDAIVSTDDTPRGPDGQQDNDGGDDMPMTQDEVDDALEELYQFLKTAAAATDNTGSIMVSPGDGYVFLSFDDAVFFEGNQYRLRPEGQAVLDYIIPALEEAGPFLDEVRVLGHTAQGNPNQPNTVRGDRTLASNRANEVLIYLLENSDSHLLDPARFISQGYGQWRPIAENDTSEGRAKNRRVEMMISGRDVEDSMDDNIKSYYAETNQEQPQETIIPENIPEVDAPVIDQHALDMLGHSALNGSSAE